MAISKASGLPAIVEVDEPAQDAAEEDDGHPHGLVAAVHESLRLVEVVDEVQRDRHVDGEKYESREGDGSRRGRGGERTTEDQHIVSSLSAYGYVPHRVATWSVTSLLYGSWLGAVTRVRGSSIAEPEGDMIPLQGSIRMRQRRG